jgi:hypothetical protein
MTFLTSCFHYSLQIPDQDLIPCDQNSVLIHLKGNLSFFCGFYSSVFQLPTCDIPAFSTIPLFSIPLFQTGPKYPCIMSKQILFKINYISTCMYCMEMNHF